MCGNVEIQGRGDFSLIKHLRNFLHIRSFVALAFGLR